MNKLVLLLGLITLTACTNDSVFENTDQQNYNSQTGSSDGGGMEVTSLFGIYTIVAEKCFTIM